MTQYGWQGRILHAHLNDLRLEVETPDEAFYRKYGGGSAFGAYYLLRHTPPGADPLGEANTLTLALSPLTGAPISGQSRMTAVAKSPQTNAVGELAGRRFFPGGDEIRRFRRHRAARPRTLARLSLDKRR